MNKIPEVKLTKYRTSFAFIEGEILLVCPDSQEPCWSRCIFFDIKEAHKEGFFHVTLSCRPVQLNFLVEESE